MSDVIFLDLSIVSAKSITQLALACKAVVLADLAIFICDEDLCPDSTNTVFTSRHKNWLTGPAPKIFTIDDTGIETLIFTPADYTISIVNGSVQLTASTTDTVRANYSFFPFTDPQLVELAKEALREISVIIYRPINPDNIEKDYRPAICKRLYTNTLKALLLEAKDFFSVSIAGRSISKTTIVSQINAVIDQNETQLLTELQSLIHHNRTNRFLPTIELTNDLDSNAFVGEEITKTINSDAEIS